MKGDGGKDFRTFEHLEVYQIARQFRTAMYGMAKRLPEIEKFALANQIRRAAVSLTNNIAEGHGRFHYLEQIKFALQSRGSLEELIDDLNVCEDEHYLEGVDVSQLKRQGWRVYQLLNGYIRHLRSRKADSPARLNETSPAYGLSDEEFTDVLGDPLDRRFNDSTV